MSAPLSSIPTGKLFPFSLRHTDSLHYQSSPDALVQDSLRLNEGTLSSSGALVIRTGAFTGRAPRDRYLIYDRFTEHTVDWNEFNIPLDEKYYHVIYNKVLEYLGGRPELWIRDAAACADERYRLRLRVVSDKPWISLFCYNMFLRPSERELDTFTPDWHIYSAPDLQLPPEECGIRHPNAVVVSFLHKTILIAGTGYPGEAKKSIFSILNYLLPREKGVLPMHCSANKGPEGDTAIFFGLSGTGKTTLSADPNRFLIGDDEHGWTADNVFNFEGGCYAKIINLSAENEPEIFGAIRPGALVENATLQPGTAEINFADASITENTRVSYPLDFIPNAALPSTGRLPDNIFFLTCDAYGVLPPLSRLTPQQAMYQFISGYTAKVAGTETGITEPKPTFSACFGAPFLPLHPGRYAEMLGEKLREQPVSVWLINTGWTGGEYGKGKRMSLAHTRALITAALEGSLDMTQSETDPVFGLQFPLSCPGVPAHLLNPRNTWDDKNAYDEKRKFLAGLFAQNFEKYTAGVTAEIREAGPKL
ncbi:phosphoenolpyruvate carboxykinase (ATP) [Paraflavisolibacter sp. H34]|uniref:phosphoenolpyruvate carboxykinase (ATP) n=1 Tax=Huijunlia imazamoxiresistens TaxID=3127457 RepID=UPI0030195802